MKAHKKLGQSLIFRYALLSPLVVGFLLLFVSAYNNPKLELCLTSLCINYFFELYKYPLSMLGLSVPLTAIAAALHRSEETSLQIDASNKQFDETLKQNVFNNYIKHKEDFFDLIEKIEVKCQCRFVDALSLYKKIFPRNGYSSFDFFAHEKDGAAKDLPHEFLETLHRDARKILSTLYDPKTDEDALILLLLAIHETTTVLQIKQSPAITYISDSKLLVWPDEFSKNSLDNLRFISKSLASFAFYKIQARGEGDNLGVNLRLPNSGSTKMNNMKAMDQLTAGIDEYL